MHTLIRDIRYALRTLTRTPGFTVVAVATLALGIGVVTAMFSVIDAVLRRPLPYGNPDDVMSLSETNPVKGWDRAPLSSANFLDMIDRQQSFTGLAAYSENRGYNLSEPGEAERVTGVAVTGNIFSVLGVEPIMGRAFTPEETWAGSDQVAVVSARLWERLGADPDLPGRAIRLDGKPYTVVGVMPPGFHFTLPEYDLWLPFGWNRQEIAARRLSRNYRAIARLKPGVTLAQAQAEMHALSLRLEQQYPDYNTGARIQVIPLSEWMFGDARPTLSLLFGAVALVLLIACLNVANLQVARTMDRSHEIAVRGALGAGRRRIIRQILTESVVLAVAGGGLGVLLAYWMIETLPAVAPDMLPRLDALRIDWRALGFTLAFSAVAGSLSGLIPAWRCAQVDVSDSLKDGSRATAGDGRATAGRLMVAVEVALALVLATSAGLLLKSFAQLRQIDPGIDTRQAVTMRIWLPQRQYPEEPQAAAFYARILERIEALPGVAAAAVTNALPLRQAGWTSPVSVEGRPSTDYYGEVRHKEVSPAYFRVMGIPMTQGRPFTRADAPEAPKVVIINETFARLAFPDEDPLGQRLKFSRPDETGTWRTVVGVVQDQKQGGLRQPVEPEIYWPLPEAPPNGSTLIVRTVIDPSGVVGAVRQAVRGVDPTIALYNVKTLEQVHDDATAYERFMTLMAGLFAVAALTLAMVGVYGVTAYGVVRRTREIGVRMALGARSRDVLALVARQGMGMVALGVGAGLLGALGATRVIASMLYEVSPTDPVTFAGVAALLILTGLAACVVPARRATRVDPMTALRYE